MKKKKRWRIWWVDYSAYWSKNQSHQQRIIICTMNTWHLKQSFSLDWRVMHVRAVCDSWLALLVTVCYSIWLVFCEVFLLWLLCGSIVLLWVAHTGFNYIEKAAFLLLLLFNLSTFLMFLFRSSELFCSIRFPLMFSSRLADI